MADEAGIGIVIRATLKGEDQPRELDLLLAQARTRNSTLWADDPRQQLAYLAVKRWARLFCPDVILGVYTPDELEDRQEKEINPAPTQKVSLADISGDTVTTTLSAQESAANIDAMADEFRDRIEAAQDVDNAKAVRADIESAKNTLGSALYTELKSKAVKRYHFVDAHNRVEAAINSLPQPGEPGAAEQFAEAERVLASARRHLGDELHDQFSITMADMKPEYVA
ncbi:RecT family protein [compost metagenome]